MKSLKNNDKGNVQLILMAVVAAIVIAVSIVIVYSIIGGIDYGTIDTAFGWDGNVSNSTPSPCRNASNSLQSNLATFYQVSPIYLIVLAAVGIISAIMMIMVTRRK